MGAGLMDSGLGDAMESWGDQKTRTLLVDEEVRVSMRRAVSCSVVREKCKDTCVEGRRDEEPREALMASSLSGMVLLFLGSEVVRSAMMSQG